MKVVSASPRRQIDDTALYWVSRLAAEPDNLSLAETRLPAAEQTRLQHWLASNPDNAQAYADARQLWQTTGLAAARLARQEDPALQAILAGGQKPRRRLGVPLSLAASFLLAVCVTLLARPERWVDDWNADYRSAPGQLKSFTLADGSEVILDGDSAIEVVLGEHSREVRLQRGAAWFHVRHNGQPFVVHAQDGEVQVLGTRFEVRHEAHGAQVSVEEGRVAVRPQPLGAEQILGAAQRVGYQQGRLTAVQTIAPEQAFAWREGRLSLRRQPLGEALAVVQRYYPGRIVLLNDELGKRPVSGDFASNDPQAMLNAFQALLGYSQQQLPGGTVIIY